MVNQRNIKSYDDFLNEGLINNLQSKIKNWWNNFQNREEFLRKFYRYLIRCEYVFLIAMLIYTYIPNISSDLHKFLGGYDIKVDTPYAVAIWILLSVLNLSEPFFKGARRKFIRKKMEEIRQNKDLFDFKFKEFYYAIIGDKKNIKAALEQLKKDDVINDSNILQTEDITIINFYNAPYIEDFSDIDPYGEEQWVEDSELDAKIKSLGKKSVAKYLESKYKVRFRRIDDIADLWDDKLRTFKKKEKIEDELGYEEELKKKKFKGIK